MRFTGFLPSAGFRWGNRAAAVTGADAALTGLLSLRQGLRQMDVLGNIPRHRPSIRWGAVLVSVPLSAVAGYVAVGRWHRALVFLAAEVLYFGLAAVAVALAQPYALYAVMLVAILHVLGALIDVARLSRYPVSQPDFAWALAAGLSAVFFTAALSWAFLTYAAESSRTLHAFMLPTIEVGDHLLVSKLARRVGRGDIIVFQLPTDPSRDLRPEGRGGWGRRHIEPGGRRAGEWSGGPERTYRRRAAAWTR